MIIHSFDDVLRAPKSIHSVELTPGGTKVALWRPISWISFLYFAVVELVFIIAARLPVLNVFSEMFAPLVYYVAFPAAVVWLAFKVELDGRAPHMWVLSYLRFLRRPKRTVAGQAVTPAGTEVDYSGRVSVTWDLHAPRLHRGWARGGVLSTPLPVRFSHAILHGRQVLRVDEKHGQPTIHEVNGKLEVRP